MAQITDDERMLKECVGKMYENQRTGKIGVVESTDLKFKTMLMRDVDGKGFNVTFPTFRRVWKDYEGDIKIETSTQKTAKAKAKEKKVEAAKKDVAKERKANSDDKRKKFLSKEEEKKIADDTLVIVKDTLDKHKLDIEARVNTKRAVVIMDAEGKRKFFEVWPKYGKNTVGTTMICMKKPMWDEVVFTKKIGEVEATVHETWNMTHAINVDNNMFADVFNCIVKAAKVVIEKEEKAKKEDK